MKKLNDIDPPESYERRLERVSKHNALFLQNVEDRVRAWSKSHPKQQPPIAKDKEGKFFWMSRAYRRKHGIR